MINIDTYIENSKTENSATFTSKKVKINGDVVEIKIKNNIDITTATQIIEDTVLNAFNSDGTYNVLSKEIAQIISILKYCTDIEMSENMDKNIQFVFNNLDNLKQIICCNSQGNTASSPLFSIIDKQIESKKEENNSIKAIIPYFQNIYDGIINTADAIQNFVDTTHDTLNSNSIKKLAISMDKFNNGGLNKNKLLKTTSKISTSKKKEVKLNVLNNQ